MYDLPNRRKKSRIFFHSDSVPQFLPVLPIVELRKLDKTLQHRVRSPLSSAYIRQRRAKRKNGKRNETSSLEEFPFLAATAAAKVISSIEKGWG